MSLRETVLELESDEDFAEYVRNYVGVKDSVAVELENLSGNINRVRRVHFHSAEGTSQSFVVKHVPRGGQLERYPTIIFPDNRLSFEAQWLYFSRARVQTERVRTPKIIHFGNGERTIIMEDLKPRMTLGQYCQTGAELKTVLQDLGGFLIEIHKASIGAATVPNNPTAALNRPFVFSKPFAQPEEMCGLWRARQKDMFKEDNKLNGAGISLSEQIQLQQAYLKKYAEQVLPILERLEDSFKRCPDAVLTHGDLHTDSILMLENDGVGVIDAELCDYGSAGFDLGTLWAHVWAGLVSANTDREKIFEALAWLLSGYAPDNSIRQQSDCISLLNLLESTAQHCGAEILRRLLGAAEFKASLSMSQRQYLLEIATRLLIEPGEYYPKWASILASCR